MGCEEVEATLFIVIGVPLKFFGEMWKQSRTFFANEDSSFCLEKTSRDTGRPGWVASQSVEGNFDPRLRCATCRTRES